MAPWHRTQEQLVSPVVPRPTSAPWTAADQAPLDRAAAQADELGKQSAEDAARTTEEQTAALKKITDHAQQVEDDAADEMAKAEDTWGQGKSLPEDDAIKEGFPVMGPEFYTLQSLMQEMVRPVADENPQQLLISGKGTFMASSTSHGAVPLSTGNQIKFATVFTKPEPQHRLPGPAGWDWAVDNAGAEKTWNGYATKIEAMKDWIAGLDDDQLVVYMDGGDIMYGGCPTDELLDRFNIISKATNASIIFGAEFNCYEPPTAGCDKYPGKGRDKVLEAFHLSANSLDAWGMDQVSNSGLSSAAFHHMALKYLNSGFYMGRVKHLREFYNRWLHFSSRPTSDQGWAAQVLQDRPDLLGLDYAGMLVNNLFGIRPGMFAFEGSANTWMNRATGKSVCFFHGNGQAKQTTFQQLISGQQ